MPYLETPTELAEYVADQLAIYGAHYRGEKEKCRVCFVPEFAERMRQAVKNELRLNPFAEKNETENVKD